MEDKLQDIRVAILATDGFEQVELTGPREALDGAGATTHLVSPEEGSIKAWDETDWGESFEVTRALDAVSPDDYDALLLPGGVLNPDQLRMDEDAVAFVRAFFDAGKPVAAICHGPQLLIEAGVVDGRRMTSYSSLQTDLRNAGADWVDQEVVVDRHLVTSRNPGDIPAFNEAMVHEFANVRTLAEV